jgi:hypothetical protein
LQFSLLGGGRLANQAHDFTAFGVPLRGFLGEDPPPIDVHFKDTAGRLNQSHLSVRVGIANLGRQTGGPWFVVSDDAVFNRDGHA